MTNEAWGKLREDLIKRVGKNNYTTWIEPIRLAELRGPLARFEVPTTFFGDWVSRNFSDHILHQLNASGETVARLEFFVPSAVSAVATPAPRQATAKPLPRLTQRRSGNDEALPGAALDARFTFDSFVVGPSNRFAHAASMAVAESPAKSYNPLFIYGPVGLGKTHLMQAIGQEILRRNKDTKVLYITSEKFTNQLINATKLQLD